MHACGQLAPSMEVKRPAVRQARFAMLGRDSERGKEERRDGAAPSLLAICCVESAKRLPSKWPQRPPEQPSGSVNFVAALLLLRGGAVSCPVYSTPYTVHRGQLHPHRCTVARSSLWQCYQPRAQTIQYRTPLPPRPARHRRALAGLHLAADTLRSAADPSHRQQSPCAHSPRPTPTGSLGIITSHAQWRFSPIPPPLDTAESPSPWLPRTPSPPRLANVAGAHLLRSTRPTSTSTTPPSRAAESQTPPAAPSRASCLPSPAPPPPTCPDRRRRAREAGQAPV